MKSLVALIALAASLSAVAAPEGAPGVSTLLPSFDQLDADGDGRLSPPAVKGSAMERRFRAMDSDGDGSVTRREYMAAMGLTSTGPSTFEQLDANQDGGISADEASRLAALKGRFEESDADRNGALDQAELSAFEAARGMEGMDLPPLSRPRSRAPSAGR